MNLMKAAVIGDEASVGIYRPLGFEVFSVTRPSDAREIWPTLLQGGYAVVLVVERVYEAIADLVDATAEEMLPAVTLIPEAAGGTGAGQRKIDRAIERALGATIPTREEDE